MKAHILVIEKETNDHLHTIDAMTCGEAQMLLEICHIAHDSGELGDAALKDCKELWHSLSNTLKP